jgi:hypothetical protein
MMLAAISRQIWIFRKIFEVTSAERGAFHIRTGSKQNIHIQRDALLSQGFAHFVDQLHIPGGSEAGCGGETSGG